VSEDERSADQAAELADRIARLLRAGGQTAAVAESVTGGAVMSRLAAAEAASEWFHGGIVAYSRQVKYSLLDVDPGPVITARCARQMAHSAALLLKADFAVATTGAGGPGPEEGKPAGTVFIAVSTPHDCTAAEYRFDGDPSAVVESVTAQALRDLAAAVSAEAANSTGSAVSTPH